MKPIGFVLIAGGVIVVVEALRGLRGAQPASAAGTGSAPPYAPGPGPALPDEGAPIAPPGDSSLPGNPTSSQPPGSAPTVSGNFASRQQAAQQLYPVARAYEAQYGIPADVLLSLNLSESGLGSPGVVNQQGQPCNEGFGIIGQGPGGYTIANDGQPTRCYQDWGQSYQDFFTLLQSTYAPCWAQYQQSGDWRGLFACIGPMYQGGSPYPTQASNTWVYNVTQAFRQTIDQLLGIQS